MVISTFTDGEGLDFEDCVCLSCGSAVVDRLSFDWEVSCVDVGYYSVSCVLRVSGQLCDMVDVVADIWLWYFIDEEVVGLEY